MKSILKRFVHLLMTLALILTLLPVRALAVETDPGWTQYGKAGHATASGDTVSFSGDPKIPFTALLFRAAEDGDYRKFTFHLSEGNSDWHTLEIQRLHSRSCAHRIRRAVRSEQRRVL